MNLRGLRILNTRPLEQGQALTKAIHQAGGISIPLPALVIEPVTNWLNKLPSLPSIQQAIFISPNAVNYFFETVKKHQLPWPTLINVVAVGNASAAALTQHGIRVDSVPAIADSEHLLQLHSLQQVMGKSILLVKGESGRVEIANTLIYRGAQLSSAIVYRRSLPKTKPQQLQSLWQDDAVDIILFTSQQAMHNIFALFGEDAHPWLCRKLCIVISERLARIAEALGMQHIIVCRYDSIITTLVEHVTTRT